jgi:hypothetical protein
MKTNLPPDAWLFNVEKAPLFATVTKEGETLSIPSNRRIALVDTDAGEVVGVVGNDYRLFTNREAIDLCREFCLEAFPDTKDSEWVFRAAHGPDSRSWVAMDLFHSSCAINLGGGFATEDFTPFVRVTNSYNASRAVRLDVGFMRGMCSNGMIFSEEAAKIFASHTDEGISRLKFSHPFENMATLIKQFGETVADVRAVDMTPDQGAEIARRVIGWPVLTDKATFRQREGQRVLDADLVARRDRYFGELGANAYAAFNLVTDFASHPPEGRRMRRDRPSLERIAGAWLRSFRTAAKKPGFTVAGHIAELASGDRSMGGTHSGASVHGSEGGLS